MKTIQPVSVWFQGAEVEATVLSSNCNYDNLSTSAQFSYQLIQVVVNPENPYMEQLTIVANGTLLMDGQTYQNWETNDYAYDWIAQQLNLTITGEYIPPVPPPPTTTSTTTTEAPDTTTTTTEAPLENI
jgi:hypothetical protein